jgi:aspartate aminotransferase-like enzyme
VPENIDSQKLREHIEKKYNLTVMGGQDQLKGKILRIGHLGYITNDDMLAFCEILYHSLKEFSMSSLNTDDLQAAKKLITQKLNV